MATTYTLISSNVLSGSAASVTFSSIPSTYTDLVLRYSARTDYAGGNVDLYLLKMNTDTGANYSVTRLYGTGSAAGSNRTSASAPTWGGYTDGNTATANTFGSGETYIPNYASSVAKPYSTFSVGEDNAAAVSMGAFAGLWQGTAAITQLVLTSANAANFVSGSSFYLYGIKNS